MLKLAALTTDGPIPVVSYARISSDNRKDEHGVKDQHRINGETAARHGWVVVHEFTDNDKSAAKAGVIRDDFEGMLKALKRGQLADGTAIRGVVVVADDRLVRKPSDYERFVDAFTYNDGFVFSDQRQVKDLYSDDVESMGLVGAVFARKEVRNIQRRMRNSHRSRALAGTPVGGPRPFGWNEDRTTLNPAEAPHLKKGALECLAGRTAHSIITEWRRLGFKTSVGNEWSVRSFKGAILNPRICGLRELNGELVRGADGEPVQGKWEPIITIPEWEGLRAVFDKRKGHFVKRNGELGAAHPSDYRDAKYLLVGILRCGKVKPDGQRCNAKLRVTRQKDVKHHMYSCPSSTDGGCGGITRRGDMADEFVSEVLLASMEDKELARRKDSKPLAWEGVEELQDVERRLAALDARWAAMDETKISDERFFALSIPLEQQRDRLRAEQRKHAASVQREEAFKVIDMAQFRRKWYTPENEGGHPLSVKRAHLREVFHAVIVHPAVRGSKRFDPDLLEPIWVQ